MAGILKTDFLDLDDASILTISSGAISITAGYHIIAAESGASDDLDTINITPTNLEYVILIIQPDTGDTITIKHATGNIYLNGASDFELSGNETLVLFYDGTNWSDIGAGGGAAGVDAEKTFGTNLIRNYPSLENADGAQPDWWLENGSGTLTEEGANGEGIPEKYDRVLKFVHSATAAGEYIYQRFRDNAQTFTTDYREKALDDNVTKISCSAWVYTADAGTLTLELYDVGASASLGTATTTTTSSWVYLSIENITFQDQTEFRIYHSANSSTFYVAMPMLNVGETVLVWKSRGIRRVDVQYNLESGIDPGGGSTYTNTDGSAGVDAQTVLFELLASYRNTSTQGKVIRIRRDGSAVDASTNNITINQTTAIFTPDFRIVQCSADRIIEYSSNANVGDSESLFLDIAAAWEWE